MLTAHEIDRFINDGFVHLEAAFSRELAAACVDELWKRIGLDRHDPATWTSPVVRIDGSAAPPLVEAINTDRLRSALDDVIGPGRWERRLGYGSFAVRFPSAVDPGDAGWHIDGSYEVGDEPPPWNYWVNLRSRGRALLLLLLYSDVTMADAPTRIRVGSHLDVAPLLTAYGDAGTPFVDVSTSYPEALERPLAFATGRAGDAYLCHPFLLHAASWPHSGTAPRFLGQPCIFHDAAHNDAGFDYSRPMTESSACERAIRRALDGPWS